MQSLNFIKKNIFLLSVCVWVLGGGVARVHRGLIVPPVTEMRELRVEEFRQPEVIIVRGSYGLENKQGLFWLNSEIIKLRVVNPLSVRIQISFHLKLVPNPCGDTTVLIKNETEDSVIGSTILYKRVLERHSEIFVDLKISGTRCQVLTDPRIFFGGVILGAANLNWNAL